MIRMLPDNEKIEYIIMGIFIGIGIGYMLAMWMVAVYG
tara:strand:- start:285 stop:398 length:114 start_codon:yes stop_codon:yes gene_type:complete